MRNIKEKADRPSLRLSKNPGVDKGPQPLMFNPALTTCASERMKTQRFSYFADFAARERMREAKTVKLKKVAFSHFFDTLRGAFAPLNYLPSAVSFFPSLSFTSAPFSASGMGRPIRPAFSSMESPSLAM